MKKKTKRCCKCGEIKEFGLFYKCAKAKTGLSSWCRSCCNKQQKKRREKERGAKPEPPPVLTELEQAQSDLKFYRAKVKSQARAIKRLLIWYWVSFQYEHKDKHRVEIVEEMFNERPEVMQGKLELGGQTNG